MVPCIKWFTFYNYLNNKLSKSPYIVLTNYFGYCIFCLYSILKCGMVLEVWLIVFHIKIVIVCCSCIVFVFCCCFCMIVFSCGYVFLFVFVLVFFFCVCIFYLNVFI